MTLRQVALAGLLLFVAVELLKAQQQAPTADVCRADAARWGDAKLQAQYSEAQLNHMQNGTRNETEVAHLRMTEILQRAIEMRTCIKVDLVYEHKYADIVHFYSSVKGDRLQAFIERHGLMAQFAQEDAQGLR
jgi:hypothetical protein